MLAVPDPHHLADLRNRAHDEHDRAAELRDAASERSDEAADLRDAASEKADQAAALRDEIGDHRAAAADRRRASADRASAATDRANARHDRNHASADRRRSAEARGHADEDRRHASKDGLTGVYLRAPGVRILERCIVQAKQTGEPLAVMFIDIDNLKTINDRHGHAAGDRMILHIAATLRASLRPKDIIFRYGGDEFVCVLTGIDTVHARQRMDAIHRALADATNEGSVSIGLAQLQPHHDSHDLIALADQALYRNRTNSTRPTDRPS
ncbi:diguanylate cyclase [Jatrophihabitans sp.]|uniref:GGDEF domain-containing protein n=1 Tax=Jatrophihabitans sp. TaxID=1932789 RepID=UPI0030C671B8